MDQNALVTSGHVVVRALDESGTPPPAAVWVHSPDTDTWKLWIVPDPEITDERDFYRRISEIVSKHRDQLGGIDAADTKMVDQRHPAISGLSRLLRLPGLGNAYFSGNRFNGYYLPEGIVLRMDLASPKQRVP
jgi:hypothetical protein